ncbi:MAG: nucleotidyltransferase domain-containing protein [Kofleriaceae bacterium]
MVIYLSGAHAYGFPSPDSDLDLKCIHLIPTARLVGLEQPDASAERLSIVDGVELDYGSNELAQVLRGALKGNGNFLERILGDLVLGGDTAMHEQLRAVTRPILSTRVSRHYGGFATSQLLAFDDKPTAKRALYVLRTAGTGRFLMSRGELVTDVARLRELLPAELDELLEIKQRGERQELLPEHAKAWRARLEGAIQAVDEAVASSCLPSEPPPAAVATVDAWLRDVRRRSWDG